MDSRFRIQTFRVFPVDTKNPASPLVPYPGNYGAKYYSILRSCWISYQQWGLGLEFPVGGFCRAEAGTAGE